MTGHRIAECMHSSDLAGRLFAASRRYSKVIEEREELMQEGWLRIAEACEDDTPADQLVAEAKRAMMAAYRRKRRRVDTATGSNVNSKGERPKRRGMIHLVRDKWLCIKAEKLDSWYAEGVWAEFGLGPSDTRTDYFHRIELGE